MAQKFHVRIKKIARVLYFSVEWITANDSWLAESNDQLA